MSGSRVAAQRKEERERARAERRGKKLARGAASREINSRILIVCEGTHTEPDYFRQFRVPSKQVEIVGDGSNTLSVVERAVTLRDAAERDDPFDAVWAVFDRDDFPRSRFDVALAKARAEGIEVAWSNEAFELWFVLHFEFRTAATGRSDYARCLEWHLGRPYQKNDASVFDALRDHISTAIRHADRLLDEHHEGAPDPFSAEPATRVHVLVHRLMEMERP